MVTINPALPTLSPDIVSLYYTKDALLEDLPIIVLYGPSITANTTHNSSRVQAHIYSLAGFQSFARLTVAPTSPVYAAVHHLPTEKQGDEVCRGLAVSLLSYFAGIPKATKTALKEFVARHRPNCLAPAMFDEMHAGELAAKMTKIEDSKESIDYIMLALSPQVLSWVDIDVILPSGTIERITSGEGSDQTPSVGDDGLPLYQYGAYTSLIHSLGSPAFLPTSKLKRAPSKATVHSRSKTLTKEQKISLRREMCEMLDTEKRYIEKVSDTVRIMAQDFRTDINVSLLSNLIDKLFPESLSDILEINTAFHDAIEMTLEETEDEAIKDIEEASTEEHSSMAAKGMKRDSTGTAAFAKTLLHWFPKFMTPYQDYMRSSAHLPQILNDAVQVDSALSAKIQEIGEQRLRSALIEPVQRLPRYSLFIENMAKLLPASHTALSNLLKAKDLVTEICALDADRSSDNTQAVICLRRFVENWPTHLSPRGRLISAADIVELDPPYSEAGVGPAGILLLFSETCVFLRKKGVGSLSARGLIAEVERATTSAQEVEATQTLTFSTNLPLSALHVSQSSNGRIMWLACSTLQVPRDACTQFGANTTVIMLLSAYEGKAARLTEEIAKARIEGRHPESSRESDKWTLRSITPESRGLGVLAAIFEESLVHNISNPQSLSNIRIVIGAATSTKTILATNASIDIVICISPLGNDTYKLDCRNVDGNASTESSAAGCISLTLSKILERMLRTQQLSRTRVLATLSIDMHSKILRGLPLQSHEDDIRGRAFRPISPVKLLSNFLISGLTSQPSTPSKQREGYPGMKDIPRMLPPLPSDSKATGKGYGAVTGDKAATIQTNTIETRDALAMSEDTLTTYVVALRSRSGNIVGRTLRGRAAANELAVSELYNTLIEDPTRVQAAAEVPVDVLFVAFEKFLKGAWKGRMGPLLASSLIIDMQTAFDTGKPADFSRRFRNSLEEMTPQNKRAFSAIIKLLAELLDGSGNDGDRGALMASFAEALIMDHPSHDFILLLDRLIEDFDMLFEMNQDSETSFNTDSLGHNRTNNSGSLSSNASSLRRKFGFGSLSRENSKSESESKVASVWRTLSKSSKSTGEPHSQPGSLSKGSLLRSRSTDTDVRMLPPLRPASRDRPVTSSILVSDPPESLPGSSHRPLGGLGTIGENTPTKPFALKKKRRSSLSDLQALRDSPAAAASPWTPSSPTQLRTPTNFQARNGLVRSSPRDQHASLQASLSKADAPPKLLLDQAITSDYLSTPQQKANSPQRFGSLQKKPASPQATRIASPKRAINRSDEAVIASSSPVKRKSPQSNIPTAKGLSERPWPPNGTTSPKKTQQSTQKLRLQSPQKLRQRLSNEQRALENSSSALQAELAAIGDELSALKRAPNTPSRIPPIKPLNISKASPVPSTPITTATAPPPTLESLSHRLNSLSATISMQTSTSRSIASLTAESSSLATQLEAANRKIKKLDALYHEANAENEALYERFNDELGKILSRVKGGEGVKVLKDRVGALEGEVEVLQKKNRSLKRDGVDQEGEGKSG